MNPFLAFALWFVTVTLALVLWMLRIYGAWAMQCPTGKSVITSYEVAEKARNRSNV